MYTFPQQQKIFKQLLSSNSSNKQCADCNTVGPTWASLNFGVFLCSNCSGAHRALGPTITRVKSTKLDQWQKQWMQCMQIGNKQLNEYWQAQLGMTKKPRMGAGQPQLLKYATQKYVKKRFVSNIKQDDPLTQYKDGTYEPKSNKNKQQTNGQAHYINKNQKSNLTVNNNHNSHSNNSNFSQTKSNVAVDKSNKGNSGNLNLMEFDFSQDHSIKYETMSQFGKGTGQYVNNGVNFFNNFGNTNKQKSQHNQVMYHTPTHNHNHNVNDNDEFSQYTQHGTSVTNNTNQKSHLTFDQLFSNKKSDDSFNGNNGKYVIPTLQHTQSASTVIHNNFGNGNNNNLGWGLPNQVNQGYPINNQNANQNIGIMYNPQSTYILGFQNQGQNINGHMNMANSFQQQQHYQNSKVIQQQTTSNSFHPYHSININNHTYNQYDKSTYLSSGGIANNSIGHQYQAPGNLNNQINLNLNQQQGNLNNISNIQNNSNNNGDNWLDTWK